MIKLLGERDTETKAIQACAELHLSLDHGIKRLQLLVAREETLSSSAERLLSLHQGHHEKLEDMGDIFEVMADTGKTWAIWLNETIATAADPASGLDENPKEALRSSERWILSCFDACIVHVLTDPLRGIFEHMKSDTLLILEEEGLANVQRA